MPLLKREHAWHPPRPVHRAATLLLSLCLPIASASQAGTGPVVRDKAEAPADLAEVFAVQDDTSSRLGRPGLELPRRYLAPGEGVEARLSNRSISSTSPALVIAAFDQFPTRGEWKAWQADGIHHADYLGNRHWLLRLTVGADTALAHTRARSISDYLATDKIAPQLDLPLGEDQRAFYNQDARLVVVDLVFDKAATMQYDALRAAFHDDRLPYVDRSDQRVLTLVTHPTHLERIAASPDVLAIHPGAWRDEPLMDGIRARVRGDDVIGTNGDLLTGEGIRMATNERLCGGVDHLDFWTNGPSPTPRITSLALSQCAQPSYCQFPWTNGGHGQMTAGIMLGNGRQSERNGGTPFAFRGLAPEATFECYTQGSAKAHVSSHSYVGGDYNWDRSVVGDLSDAQFHAHTIAAGNSGLSLGYQSILNDSKNGMVVGNAQVHGQIHPTSSAGPTTNGRIKPDITAPTRDFRTVDAPGFSLEIEWIMLTRNGQQFYKWAFDGQNPLWHEGWGQAQPSSMGQVFLNASQTAGGNMRLDMDSAPWGTGWTLSPLIGTQVVPYSHPFTGGSPLDFIGHESDVLSIRYRAVAPFPPGGGGLEYFQITPTWFRSFPPSATGDSGWHSQGRHSMIAIGDGAWRTLDVPIGLAGPWIDPENPYWDDEETWNGEPIQYLALRLRSIDLQPTPRFSQRYDASGGTSGASPVVAGAYALAMEHFTQIFPGTNLYLKYVPSAIAVGPAPPGPIFGMPFNSTWKAVFVHTARDMVRTAAPSYIPPNPDTGAPNVYHAGPDYSTGYGMLDIQRGIDLMTNASLSKAMHGLLESEISTGEWHTYETVIDDGTAGGQGGFKVTLVWDDEPTSNRLLVNNLGLIVQDPEGNKYYPWSLKVPDLPITAGGIVPAQRDQPNDRDNIEQVLIDDIPDDRSGTWSIHVVDNGMAGLGDQKYSLVISPWDAPAPCIACK